MGCPLDLLKSPREPAAAWEKREGRREGDDDVMGKKKKGMNKRRRLALNGQWNRRRYDFERCISALYGGSDKKDANGPSCLLCVPSVRWLLFSSTVEQLGDSFTVAYSPPGQEQSSGTEATQGQSNRPVCYTFQSNANAAEIQQPSGHLENLDADQLATSQPRATRPQACLNGS